MSNFSVGKGSSVDDDFFPPDDSLNSHSPVLGPKRCAYMHLHTRLVYTVHTYTHMIDRLQQ